MWGTIIDSKHDNWIYYDSYECPCNNETETYVELFKIVSVRDWFNQHSPTTAKNATH